MTVSSSTNRVNYNGDDSTTVFAYAFKVFDQDDLTVILRSSNGTETVQTITTNYTVSGVGDAGGGNVTMVTAPATGEQLTILREQPLTQGLDLVPNDPFPANSIEESLDKITFMVQKHEEELGRAIKASRTNTISGAEFTISASDRANKIFAFDSSGDVSITQAIGTFKGDWAASTSYVVRDIVKDTNNNNIYIANTAHTSSGSVPLSSNADIAKWDLLVDAASATTSATNAATSAAAALASETAAAASETAAATSESNAASSASAASTSETNAATSATAAAASQVAAANSAASAAAAFDNFDDTYLGSKASDPTVDNDGDPLTNGDLYFNSTANEMRVYDGANWIAATSAGNVSLLNYSYTATSGQTTFSGADDNAASLSYTAQNLIVTLNGIVLEDGTDYTATSGTSIVLSSGAATGDELNIVAFKSFTTADMVPASTGGTFSGNVAVNGDLTVDTNTLYVDSTNNRVGVGNTSPAQALDVTGDIVTSGGLYVGGTGAANKLDDYEEGTFSPFWCNSSGNAIFDTAPSTVNARYTKVGDAVHASGYFAMPSSFATTASYVAAGDLYIGGLPFTSNRSGSNDFYAGTVGWFQGFTGFAAGYTPMVYTASATTIAAVVYANSTTVTPMPQSVVNFASSGIFFSVSYKTAS